MAELISLMNTADLLLISEAKAFVNIFKRAYGLDAPPIIFHEKLFEIGGSPISAGTSPAHSPLQPSFRSSFT
jgi:hypothetical protein